MTSRMSDDEIIRSRYSPDPAGRLRAIAISEQQVSRMGGAPDSSVNQTQAFLAEVAQILADMVDRHVHEDHEREGRA